MLFWILFKLAIKSLFANKLRSFLAMLGIVIGVGAVISMLAIAKGAQQQVMERISSMGTNLLIVRPGQRGSHGVASETEEVLTVEDAQAILNTVSGVYQMAPLIMSRAQVKYLNKNSRTNVIGTSTTYFSIRNFEVEQGRNFTEGEVNRQAWVAVIGPTVAENLFGSDKPVGETFKIKGLNFRIVGLLKTKGDQGWFNPDDQVIVPYTTAMKIIFGLDQLREIDIQATPGADLTKIQEDTTKLLRKLHRLQPETPDNFNVRNQAEIVDVASSISQTFTILLGGIASISLLVGGIGIMNIMLVTVTERTREIGIRKAIGAKDRDILRQFLIEAVIMTAMGGLIGIAMGMGIAYLIDEFSPFQTIVEPLSILMALSFSAGIGIFFGYYPARRAAQLDPIVALRYE
ncbi:ABC transporter permease [Deltaproteobacteria bacterium TL4]